MACLMGATAVMAQDHWTCDINRFEYDMTVFLHLYDNDQWVSGDDYEVAAFCGEECRGVAKVQSVTFLGKEERYYYLRVRSNAASGEVIHFKVYKKSANMEVDALETVDFQAQEAVGLPSDPFVIHILSDIGCEAYAVLSPDSTTLTFYYDNFKATREDIVYELNTGTESPGWLSVASSISQVTFDPSFADARPTSTCKWFCNMSSITEIEGLQYLDTSKVTNMSGMFEGCCSLTSIDVSLFKTSNVNNMSRMFYGCDHLTSLDLSRFTLASNLYSANMLYGCSSLTSLAIPYYASRFNATAFTGVGTVENPCFIITPDNNKSYFGDDIANEYFIWKGGYFTLLTKEKMPYAYIYGSDRTSLIFYFDRLKNARNGVLRIFDVNPSSSSRPQWYSYRSWIERVVFDASFADYEIERTDRWFYYLEVLKEVMGIENLNLSKWKSAFLMFDYCTSLTSLDFNGVHTPVVDDLRGMFQGCSALTHLDVSGIDVSNARYLSHMFWGCSSLESLDVSHFNTSKATTLASLFDRCYLLKAVDVTGFNTSNCTSFHSMFEDCFALESVDVSLFDTSKATDMAKMFAHCHTLTSLDVSHFDMGNVENSDSIFLDCPLLQTFSISASMENLGVNACLGIGTAENPCTIIAPVGFDFGVDTSGDYFLWKGGYFKLGSAFLPGDVNHDGAVNITDVMLVVNHILGQTPVVFFKENADMNGDDSINITDLMLIVDIILHGN